MRLLVACPECHRQYDATGREVGSRFRCHCGTAVEVRQPLGHDARVVRCSSCGAPREQQAERCSSCHSDFTLHERDLHTVCPKCMSRVSDHARFCHSCAAALMPEELSRATTEYPCPACGDASKLQSRSLGDLQAPVLECDRCAGLWIGTQVFAELARQATQHGTRRDPLFAGARSRPPQPTPQSQGPFYRSCAVCGKLMPRRNYSHRSGVIVDLCKEHGIWFDADELPRVLAWLRAGGSLETERVPEVKARTEAHRKRTATHPSRRGEPATTASPDEDPARLEDWAAVLIGEGLEALIRLFIRKLF